MMNLFINVMEILAEILLFDTFMFRKSKTRLTMFFIADAVNVYICSYFIRTYEFNTLFRIVLLVSFCFFLSYIAYYDTIWKRLFSVMVFYNLVFSVDLGIVSLILLFSKMTMNQFDDTFIYDVASIFSKLVLLLITIILSVFWRKTNLNFFLTKKSLISVLLPLAVIMSIYMAGYQDISINKTDLYSTFTIIGLFIIVIYQMIILVREKYNALTEQEKQILQNMNNVTIQNMKQLMKSYEGQRRLTHDFNNEINSIKGLLQSGNDKKAIDYISSLQKRSNTTILNYKTNNPMVDVIINTKYAEAEANDIIMNVDINDLSQLPLQDEDIVTILGNGLNNAIEACLKLPPENRQITVKILCHPESTLILIQNPVASPVKIKNNRVSTSKQDTLSHGYGLRNIEFALSKYEHDYHIFCQNGSFQLSIEIFH